MASMEPIRAEHRELLPRLEHVREAADAVGEVEPEELRRRLAAVVDFLAGHLVPHAKAEDAALYPAVDRLMGSGATATMGRDHVAIVDLVHELEREQARLAGAALDPEAGHRLRRVLYGIHALATVHFAKEEEIYLPLLERGLADEEAETMFAAMGHGAARHQH